MLFLLRSVARKAQFDFALVKLRKFEISTSTDNLEAVNLHDMALVTQLTQ